jgi:YVTN family beta-propeller protein
VGYTLGVDLGTTSVAAAVARGDRLEMVGLGDRATVMPAAVFAREDGLLVVGDAAVRRAVSDPDRVVRDIRRKLLDPTPVVLGGVSYTAIALLGTLLQDVLARVAEDEGGEPDGVVLALPATWRPVQRGSFEEVSRFAGLTHYSAVTEPEAAAAYHAATRPLAEGAIIAVYDLGGSTFDAAVLRRTADGVEILGVPESVEDLGGAAFDELVLSHVDHATAGALSELDGSDPRAVRALARLRQECVLAKEALTFDTETTIPVSLPGRHMDAELTRDDFEDMIRTRVESTLVTLAAVLRTAAIAPGDLSVVLLVGGSSHIPLVRQMVAQEIGRPTVLDAHPEYVVALGAATQVPARVRGGADPSAGVVAPELQATIAAGAPSGSSTVKAEGPAAVASRIWPMVQDAPAGRAPEALLPEQGASAPSSAPDGSPSDAAGPGDTDENGRVAVEGPDPAPPPAWFAESAGHAPQGLPPSLPASPPGPAAHAPEGLPPPLPASPPGPAAHAPEGLPPPPPASPRRPAAHAAPEGRPRSSRTAPDGTRRRPLIVAIVVLISVGVVGVLLYLNRESPRGSAPSGQDGAETSTPSQSASPTPPPAASVPVPSLGGVIQVGETPGSVVVSPNGRHLYVARRAAGFVTVVDTAVDMVTAHIPIETGPPQYLAFSPDGDTVYVSVFDDARTIAAVSVLDTTTNAIVDTVQVDTRPYTPAVTPDGTRVYVPNHDSANISVIDTATNDVLTDIAVPRNPHFLSFTPDGSRAYVANHESNVVAVVDTATNTVLDQVPVGTSPHSVAVHRTLPLSANVNFDAASVTMIDTDTNEVRATIPVQEGPQHIAWAADGRFAYVTNVRANSVSVISADDFTVTATIPTGVSPTSIAVLPDGSRGYVTNLDEGTLTVLNLTAG